VILFNSIRWRLQLWHGLLLVLVLAGFGFTAYQLQRANQLRRIDQDLQYRISVIASAMRGPGEGRGGPPRDGHRPPDDVLPPPFERRPPGAPELRPGRPDSRAEDFMPPRPREVRLSPQDLRLFEGSPTNAFYYVVWRRDGQILSRSDSAPDLSCPERRGEMNSTRMRGTAREMFHHTPPGECVLVGRNIASELADIRQLVWLLLTAGGSVLVLGLAGGWWLATRAIRPIKDISATAAKISTGDLSQRIPAGNTDNELGQLADVLNSTFTRLETAFAQQARFTADAAHELRTPVSVMLTQTQSALTRERPAAEYRESLEACQRAAQRMRRLIESLLELARLDAGQEAVKHERVDLAQTAGDCVELVRPLASERRITIQAALPSIECVGDADRLAQVITNLLTNAIHYNKDGGEVRISAEQKNRVAILTVADTGQGIAPADLPHVFERFWRADQARSSASGRTGLGLAIAKSIVNAHGGNIEVSSQPGAGSTFTVRLPMASQGQ
jgi:heavy metal sensor kinase